jgi:hypothetical protein
MPPEVWSVGGIVISAFVGYLASRLQARAKERETEANKEVNAGQLALSVAREAKDESTAAKLDASNARSEASTAHREAEHARRALHQTLVWYQTQHLPWDMAVLRVVAKLSPEAAKNLPERTEPPAWEDRQPPG